MLGRRVAHPEFILRSGECGASFVFKAAVDTSRFLWISSAFSREHWQISELIKVTATYNRSKWKLIEAESAFIKKYLATIKTGSRTRVLALVRTNEKCKVGLPGGW